MKSNFFITGLPRSRTAWLAAFLSAAPDVLCLHEAFMDYSYRDFAGITRKYKLLGNSDCGIAIFVDEFMQVFPDSPLVIIERNPEESLEALYKAFPETRNALCEGLINDAAYGIDLLKLSMDPLVVAYEDIDNRIAEIWHKCLGDRAFDADRFNSFSDLNIQATRTKYQKRGIL